MKNITQKMIAKEVNVTQGAISRFMTGKISPSLKIAKSLYKKFGFPYDIWGDTNKIKQYLKDQEAKEKAEK